MAEYEYSCNGYHERAEKIWETVRTRLNRRGIIVAFDRTKGLAWIRLLLEYLPSVTDEEIVSSMEAGLRNPSVLRNPDVLADPGEFRSLRPDVARSATPEDVSLHGATPLAGLAAIFGGIFDSLIDDPSRK